MKESFIEKQVFESITWDKLHERAQKFNKENPPIDPTEFVDVYDERAIQGDLNYTQKLKDKFETSDTPEEAEVKKHADVFEAIILDQIERSDWMGSNADTITPSIYDDIVNGVDAVVELLKDGGVSHLALAVDVTHGQDFDKKIGRIKKEIESGELTQVKYFKSEDSDSKGKLEHIPRVIIGADKNTVLELGELWLERDNNALANHKMQFMILEEIKMQLEAFRDYAASVKRIDVANKYAESLSTVEGIILEKSEFYISGEELKEDRVFSAMCKYMKNF